MNLILKHKLNFFASVKKNKFYFKLVYNFEINLKDYIYIFLINNLPLKVEIVISSGTYII